MTSYRRVLVLGGARSGKSQIAQSLAEQVSGERIYVATAQGLDQEMQDRIAHHRSERDLAWRTQEVPLALADAIRSLAGPGKVVLVDCLTLWLSNVLLVERDPNGEVDLLLQAVREVAGPVILVSNEVGQGIVPGTPLGRTFRDEQGRLNRRMAEVCDAVLFVAAGCPVLLKPAPPLHIPLG